MVKVALVSCKCEGGEIVLKELNHVIDYIEKRLTDDISLETISEYAGVSDYHFRKVFFIFQGLRSANTSKTGNCRKQIRIC